MPLCNENWKEKRAENFREMYFRTRRELTLQIVDLVRLLRWLRERHRPEEDSPELREIDALLDPKAIDLQVIDPNEMTSYKSEPPGR
jgi:hypothetical protein